MATLGFTTTPDTFVQIDAYPASESGIGFGAKKIAPAFSGESGDAAIYVTGATVLFPPYYRAGRRAAALRAHGTA